MMVRLYKRNRTRLSRIVSFYFMCISPSLSYNCLLTSILTSNLTSNYAVMSQPPSLFTLESAGAITATMQFSRDQVQLPELDLYLTFNIMMKLMLVVVV
jgi:hypothetical protein